MPIFFEFNSGDVIWTQRLHRPAVYLDTFAIRAIAEDDGLCARFSQSLKAQNGTWLLSTMSIGEFARFADPRHAEKAERLLSRVVPHIYLFLSDPQQALAKRGTADLSLRSLPPADKPNLNCFSRKWAQTQSVQETFSGMFRLVYEHRTQIDETLSEMTSKVVTSVTENRQSQPYRNKAKMARLDDGRTRHQVIAGELLRDLILDLKSSFKPNDAADLVHAINAVDYCDLVLLDKAWERRVNALHQRIAKEGILMPIARCLSTRNGGIEHFLEAIERWPSQP